MDMLADIKMVEHLVMPLFLTLKQHVELDAELIQNIKSELKVKCLPRHIPDEFIVVSEIPYTLTGKKMEIPVRKLLMGNSLESVFSIDSMKNPNSMDYFIEFSKKMI